VSHAFLPRFSCSIFLRILTADGAFFIFSGLRSTAGYARPRHLGTFLGDSIMMLIQLVNDLDYVNGLFTKGVSHA
jgi:hypothetical protein